MHQNHLFYWDAVDQLYRSPKCQSDVQHVIKWSKTSGGCISQDGLLQAEASCILCWFFWQGRHLCGLCVPELWDCRVIWPGHDVTARWAVERCFSVIVGRVCWASLWAAHSGARCNFAECWGGLRRDLLMIAACCAIDWMALGHIFCTDSLLVRMLSLELTAYLGFFIHGPFDWHQRCCSEIFNTFLIPLRLCLFLPPTFSFVSEEVWKIQ